MFMSTPSWVALLATVLPLTQAQTWSSCNPLQRTCPANPALGQNLNTNFVGASALPAGWAASNGYVSFDATGAKFTVAKQGDSPTIGTTGYFLFGYAEVKIRAAAGQGIVSSIVLESDDLDEVDWEFTGTDTANVQTNYFGKGDTTTYDRGGFSPISNPQSNVYTYAINWTPTTLQWLINGNVVRTLNYNDAKGGTRYPQTPMRLKLGIWAGGDPSLPEGTIKWAGGRTDYSQPYSMWVQSVSIVNYSPATSYTYSDNSGSWQSIKAAGGTVNSGAGVAAPVAATSSVRLSSSSSSFSSSSSLVAQSTIVPTTSTRPAQPTSTTTLIISLTSTTLVTRASSVLTSAGSSPSSPKAPAAVPLSSGSVSSASASSLRASTAFTTSVVRLSTATGAPGYFSANSTGVATSRPSVLMVTTSAGRRGVELSEGAASAAAVVGLVAVLSFAGLLL